MAMEHQPDCDQLHTPRQPCNDAPAEWPADTIIAATASNGASDIADAEGDAHEGVARPASATQEMPAPSPRVLRAWEDTAAAVGATATPAPPPHPIVEAEAVRERGWFSGHAVLVAIVAAVTLVVFLIARRR